MTTVTLRKLAHKSVWDYGKYRGYTVKDLLIMNKKYLIWSYYNLEKISFIDEILDEFATTYKERFKRIDKPGKDPEHYDQYIKGGYGDMTKEQLRKLIAYNKMNGIKCSVGLMNSYRVAKSKAIHANRTENITKASLQAMNHGSKEKLTVRKSTIAYKK